MAIEEATIEVQGKVTAVLANTQFRIRLDNGHEIVAHISGKYVTAPNRTWRHVSNVPENSTR